MKDERLESEAQRQAAEWVHSLPKDEPSLVWRATLNAGIRAEAERRMRKRWSWTFARPIIGLATAAALAFAVFTPRLNERPIEAGRVEANLLALYEESQLRDDVVGIGLRPSEAKVTPVFAPDSDLDLEAL